MFYDTRGMKNTAPTFSEVPSSHRKGPGPAESRSDAEKECWENEGGALNTTPNEPVVLSEHDRKSPTKTEYAVLVAGLPICFGLATLLLTVGARPEEAAASTTMTFYGALSIASGIVFAALFWIWRNVRESRGGLATHSSNRLTSAIS